MPKVSPDRPIEVVLVGYGMAAATFHAPLICAAPSLCLRTIVSGRAQAVALDHPAIVVQPDISSALMSLSAVGPECLVVIATPNATHYALALQALQAGRHVVVDKPFTLSTMQAQHLAQEAQSRGLVLSVFHNRRWDGDFLTLQRLLAEGTLGDIYAFESRFDRFRPTVRARWREQAGPGAGIWYDLGPHLLDQALQLFGRPDALYVDLAQQRKGADAPDYVHALLRYPRRRVTLHAGMVSLSNAPRFVALGDRGAFIKFGMDPQEAALKAGFRPGDPDWGVDPEPGVLTVLDQQGVARSAALPAVNGGYEAFYPAVAAAIRGESAAPVSAAEAIEVMGLIELGMQSAEARRELPA